MIGITLFAAACQSPAPPKVETPAIKPAAAKPETDQIGEHMIADAAQLLTENQCQEAKSAPLANFEDQRLIPAAVVAGEKFTHHLVYAVCDADPAHVIEGTLYRKIFLKGRLLHSEPVPFLLKPGRWAVNALIEVPAKSKPGAYTLKTEFIGKGSGKQKIKLAEQSAFEVRG